jgi:Uma2 family endonuclease
MSSLPLNTPDGLEPVWDIATLYPSQGAWSEEDYLALTDSTNRLIELTDGRLEFLEMPSEAHQLIMAFLFEALRDFVRLKDAGLVLFMGLRVRIRPDKIREPDIVFISKENYARRDPRYWLGADLVMEIVSPDEASRNRDHRRKALDCAEAGIPEYWIVDPEKKEIAIMTLGEGAKEYSSYGVFRPDESAASKQLEGFAVDVQAVFDAANV